MHGIDLKNRERYAVGEIMDAVLKTCRRLDDIYMKLETGNGYFLPLWHR
jgi:hypothetical protein